MDQTVSVTDELVRWGEIDGVPIEFPMVVEELHQATLTFSVPLEPAARLLPRHAFRPIETEPGVTMLVVALVDYRRNPWGDYNEVNLGILAHPEGRGAHAGTFVYRMPVDQRFTMVAGNRVLGLPKTLEEVTFSYEPERVSVELRVGGRPALSVSMPRPAPSGPPTVTDAVTFSMLDGVPTELPLRIEVGSGVADPAQVQLELGTSALADELRSLGLPTTPDVALWGEGLTGTFWAPRPV